MGVWERDYFTSLHVQKNSLGTRLEVKLVQCISGSRTLQTRRSEAETYQFRSFRVHRLSQVNQFHLIHLNRQYDLILFPGSSLHFVLA